jgi:Super-infection exclusion protein B
VEWVGSLITIVINAGTRIYVAALIASAAILFSPPSLVTQLGLDNFRQTYKAYIGTAFIVSLSLLITSMSSAVWSIILSPYRDRLERKKYITMFEELTFAEKRFLVPFIQDGENTRYADLHDGVARGLEAKGILYRPSNMAVGFEFPFNLQPIARRILNDRPELLSP